jgi:hypothetical protein
VKSKAGGDGFDLAAGVPRFFASGEGGCTPPLAKCNTL